MVDVLVAGSGPAGWSVASACARLGLSTVLVAPRPMSVWPATYGMWADEAGALPAGSRYVTARPRGVARDYVVLDNVSVLDAFRDTGVRVLEGTLASAGVTARVVLDATGARRAGGVEQSAFGVVVPAAVAEPILRPGEAVFMDWRGHTFLYAVPLPDGRVLLEETSLARRPGLGMRELRARLYARLAEQQMKDIGKHTSIERVRFTLDVPPPPIFGRGAIPFGAAAGFVHPATGFSVADSFRLAPKVAEAIARNISRGSIFVDFAVRQAMWPPAARIVHRLRRRGLSTLLALAPEQLPAFFDLFFALPPERQRAYLSGREDVRGTAAAMSALYGAAPRSLRRVMMGWAKPVNLNVIL